MNVMDTGYRTVSNGMFTWKSHQSLKYGFVVVISVTVQKSRDKRERYKVICATEVVRGQTRGCEVRPLNVRRTGVSLSKRGAVRAGFHHSGSNINRGDAFYESTARLKKQKTIGLMQKYQKIHTGFNMFPV